MRLYTYTWMLLLAFFLPLGVAWLIFGHKPSEFVVLLLGIAIVGETVIEGVQNVCKRLDEISEILKKAPSAG